jgi:hypothetical protein
VHAENETLLPPVHMNGTFSRQFATTRIARLAIRYRTLS